MSKDFGHTSESLLDAVFLPHCNFGTESAAGMIGKKIGLAIGGQKVTWSTWGLQQSKTGVYGDPTMATKEMGEFIIKAAVKNYREFILEYFNYKRPNL